MKRSLFLAVAASCLLGTAASAQQDVRPFPMDLTGRDPMLQGPVLTPRLDEIALLMPLEQVVFTNVPTPEGKAIDVSVRRLDVARRKFGFRVDGQDRRDLLQDLDLSIWRGHVVGEPTSEVLLSFSNRGSRGWILSGSELLHLIGRPDESGNWTTGNVLVTTESDLNSFGMRLGPFCASESLYPDTETWRAPQRHEPPTQDLGSGCGLKECKIAVETDFQLFGVFGDLGAMTSYMATLLTAISDRYEEQIATTLTFPYLQYYTTPADPWSTPDIPGSTGQMLDEFLAAWTGNIPAGADLAHFISGASLGGGIAYLDVLCIPEFAFGVSANIGGDVNFPVVQQSGNWDFMVIAHELGHNFAAPHTHDLGIDNCAGGDHITDGTVMSYCHTCPGGTANITTYFHPTNVGIMTAASQNCLTDFGGEIMGEDLSIVATDAPTAVTAQVFGSPLGTVDLVYRYDGGAFQTVAMTDQGNGAYSGSLPAGSCDDSPEYYFTFTGAECGAVTDPAGAPASVYTALVGTLTPSFSDDFEVGTGWTEVNLGASSGDWQRGVPVDDGGWDYDPASDYDGSGSAYLTQNEVGNTDVDGGAVELTSPTLDMSGTGASIQYAYFLRLSNQNGIDALVVEINTNGGAGSWTEIARHDTDGGLNWRTHFIPSDALAAAGVTPTANVQLRFTVNDDDPQSIVEAGLDAFEITTVSCEGGPTGPGTASCFGVGCPCANDDPAAGCGTSTGSGALLGASGTNSASADDLNLEASGVPTNNNGLFYMGDLQVMNPFFDGFQCALGNTFRFISSTQSSGGTGTMSFTGVVAASGLIVSGSTWHFHCWFRDVPGSPCSTGANLTNLYSVTFTP